MILEKKGIDLNLKKYEQEIIMDAKIPGESFDKIVGVIDSDQKASLQLAGNDLQALFEQIIKNNLGSFQNIKRSIPKIKTTIYIFFQKYLGSNNWDEEMVLVQKIFVHNGNRIIFERILLKAIDSYKIVHEKKIKKRSEENEQFYDFNIKRDSFYNQHDDEVFKTKKYIYDPCYLKVNRSNPEREFEKFINENDKLIEWWWKNGEKKRDYFGIKYEYPKGIVHTFYPDYLIQCTNGAFGILEVKDQKDQDGDSSTKAKAEALNKYMKLNLKNKKKLFGGIVIKRNNVWLINNKKIYDWQKCLKSNWEDWESLELK